MLTLFFAYIRREEISFRSATHLPHFSSPLFNAPYFFVFYLFIFILFFFGSPPTNFPKTSRESFLNARDRLDGAEELVDLPFRLGPKQHPASSTGSFIRRERERKRLSPRYLSSHISLSFSPIAFRRLLHSAVSNVGPRRQR